MIRGLLPSHDKSLDCVSPPPSRPQLKGQATANGCALSSAATLRDLRPLLGFVAKEDVVDRRLTPRELFTLSARQVRSDCNIHVSLRCHPADALVLRSTCQRGRHARPWTQPWHARFAPST